MEVVPGEAEALEGVPEEGPQQRRQDLGEREEPRTTRRKRRRQRQWVKEKQGDVIKKEVGLREGRQPNIFARDVPFGPKRGRDLTVVRNCIWQFSVRLHENTICEFPVENHSFRH